MNQERMTYDVAIVGASLAGCTAATFYGRQGLKVALIERRTDLQAYKKICAHFIQPSATPTLERLGIIPEIEAAGGIPNTVENWTQWGWIRSHRQPGIEPLPYGYNIQRKKLDPMVRNLALSTPGVDYLPGYSVRQLIRQERRIAGVTVKERGGQTYSIQARLVVGADGRHSAVAKLAQLKTKITSNIRFAYLAYYRNLPLDSGTTTRFWFLQPEVAYALPNDEGLTLLVCFLPKDKLTEFKQDIEGNFERFFERLPHAPPLRQAERVSEVMGILDMPNTSRPAVSSGLALVGDAALASDPLWGVGCSWALESAAWLVDHTAEALRQGGDLERALKRYKKKHRVMIRGHHFIISSFSKRPKFNPIEVLFTKAAVKDPVMARNLHAIGARLIKVREFFTVATFARALWVILTR